MRFLNCSGNFASIHIKYHSLQCPDDYHASHWSSLACRDDKCWKCFYKWLSAKCDLMYMQAGRKIPGKTCHQGLNIIIRDWMICLHNYIALVYLWNFMSKLKSCKLRWMNLLNWDFRIVMFINFMKRKDHFADLCWAYRPPPGDILIFCYLRSCTTWVLGHVMHIKHNY